MNSHPEENILLDINATTTAVDVLSEEPLLPPEGQMWNVEPAHSWTPGVRGHRGVQGVERGKGGR